MHIRYLRLFMKIFWRFRQVSESIPPKVLYPVRYTCTEPCIWTFYTRFNRASRSIRLISRTIYRVPCSIQLRKLNRILHSTHHTVRFVWRVSCTVYSTVRFSEMCTVYREPCTSYLLLNRAALSNISYTCRTQIFMEYVLTLKICVFYTVV